MSKSVDPVLAWGQQFQSELKHFFDSLQGNQKAFCEKYAQYQLLSKIAEQSALISAIPTKAAASTNAGEEIKKLVKQFEQYSFKGNQLPFRDSKAEHISTRLVAIYYDHFSRFKTLPSKYPGSFHPVNISIRTTLNHKLPKITETMKELKSRLDNSPIDVKPVPVEATLVTTSAGAGDRAREVKSRSSSTPTDEKLILKLTVDKNHNTRRLLEVRTAITTCRNQLFANKNLFCPPMIGAALTISKAIRSQIKSFEVKERKLEKEIERLDNLIKIKTNKYINGNTLVNQIISSVESDFNTIDKGSQQKLIKLLTDVVQDQTLQKDLINPIKYTEIKDILVAKVRQAFYTNSFPIAFFYTKKGIYFEDTAWVRRPQALSKNMLLKALEARASVSAIELKSNRS